MLITTSTQKTLDQRVHEVALQLKCPICAGESVADSSTYLAQQMRALIHDQLQAGRSEQEVIQYFVQRYGDQIVLLPSWQGFSLLVWLVPIVLLIGSGALLLFRLAPVAVREKEQALVSIDEGELEHYRSLLEQELAEEDLLFGQCRRRETQ
jgi:cytochrome c-type biogenesis protein CcmH